MTVVTTPALAESVEELMIEVDDETPLMMEVRVLTAEERELALMKDAVVVATLPLTVEVRVKELVEVETVRVLEVEEATRLVKSVVVATPLMMVVRVAPLVERAFEVMILEVACTPLTVEVRTLPDADWVKELMIEARLDEIPLVITWKRLADEDAVFEVMIVEVPIDPPRLEVRVLPEAERVLEVERLVKVGLVAVAEVTVSAPMNAEERVAPVAERLVVEALVVVRAEMNPLVKVRPVPEMEVEEALVVVRLVIVEEEKVGVAEKV